MHNFINLNILFICIKRQITLFVCSKERCIIKNFHADLLLTIFITTHPFFTWSVSTVSEEEVGEEFYIIHFLCKYITYTVFNTNLLGKWFYY